MRKILLVVWALATVYLYWCASIDVNFRYFRFEKSSWGFSFEMEAK